jgi:hypothetical protein
MRFEPLLSAGIHARLPRLLVHSPRPTVSRSLFFAFDVLKAKNARGQKGEPERADERGGFLKEEATADKTDRGREQQEHRNERDRYFLE